MAFVSNEQRKAVMAKLRGALGSKPVAISTEIKPEEQVIRDIKYISDTDIVMGPEEVPHLFEDRHHIENLEIDAALRGTGGVIDRKRVDLPMATKSYYEKFPYIHPMEKDPKVRAKFSEVVKEGGIIKKVGNTFVELRPTEVSTIIEASNGENIPKDTVVDILRNAVELPDEIHEIGGDTSVGIAPTDVVFHDGVYYSNLRALPIKKSKVIQWRDDDENSEDYVSKGDFSPRRS